NRRGVVFHQDNAKPHTSIVTRQKFWELGWEVLMHPPYSPDLAPSDYHIFLSLQNFLSDKKLASREDCENRLVEFFVDRIIALHWGREHHPSVRHRKSWHSVRTSAGFRTRY
ncbi:Histone-lysine N-methyltransferase SETMAR, partial [Dufourea novaeangliae]